MQRNLTRGLTALSVMLVAAPAMAQTAGGRPDYWHYGWSWGHMVFGSLMMILFWGVIVVAIVLAVRWLGSGSSQATPSATLRNKALDILEERFAQGEIDKDEFVERKRLLSD